MSDCANVDMRELLPDFAGGMLDAHTHARVEAHVAGCADCASELETLRLVRRAFANALSIDVQRIVAALPQPSAVPAADSRSRPSVRRWTDWRIAAALTMITVGGLSVAVTQRMRLSNNADSSLVQQRPDSSVSPTSVPPAVRGSGATTTQPAIPPRSQAVHPVRAEKAQLSFGGGVDGLDRAAIEALMGALDEIDRAPVAPSVEPDRAPLLPVITEGRR